MVLSQTKEPVLDMKSVSKDFRELAAFYNGENLYSMQLEVRKNIRACVIRSFVGSGSCVIEVGAGVGDETALFAIAAGKAGLVFSVECDPYLFEELTFRADQLNATTECRVSALDLCLASEISSQQFFFSKKSPGLGTIICSLASDIIEVEQRVVLSSTIDTLAVDNHQISLISIDTQGSFKNILDGARATLRRHRPVVLFEYMNLSQHNIKTEEIIRYFEEERYIVYDLCGYEMRSEIDHNECQFWERIAIPSEVAVPVDLAKYFIAERYRLFPFPELSLSEQFKAGIIAEVEVLSLQTAAKLEGVELHYCEFDFPAFNVGTRQLRLDAETLKITQFDQAGIVVNQGWPSTVLWKVMPRNNIWLEEVGHTTGLAVYGSDFWFSQDSKLALNVINPFAKGLPNNVFLLGGEANYFHWITNWLPRMRAFDEFGKKLSRLKDASIIVSDQINPAQIESLQLLGISDDRMIKLPHSLNYEVSGLFVSSVCGISMVSKNSANWLKSRYAANRIGSSKKIYISRNDVLGARRRVENDAEVRTMLSKLGFESVTLNGRSFQDQIDIFANAETVIAPHGAGLANLVFAPLACRVIVIENSWKHDWLVDFLNQIGCEACIFEGTDVVNDELECRYRDDASSLSEIRRNRNMTVDLAGLRSLVTRYSP